VFYFYVICLIVFCCSCLYIFCVCLYKICGVFVYFVFFFFSVHFLQPAIERRSVGSIAYAIAFMYARAHRATQHAHSALRARTARFCPSAIERTLVRSSALDSEPPHVTFLGHLLLSPLHFPSRRTAPSPILSVFLSHPIH
jgi:hypothetical protein